jgi:hypothetical protein
MNKNSGIHHPGQTCNLEKKIDVGYKHIQAFQDSFPTLPTISDIAKSASVSPKFVTKAVDELGGTGQLSDPDVAKAETDNRVGPGASLTKEEVVFLLSFVAKHNRVCLSIMDLPSIPESPLIQTANEKHWGN